MEDISRQHFIKLQINTIKENVDAEPKVACTDEELQQLINEVHDAIANDEYVPSTPTEDNPALSDDYVFDLKDEKTVLKDLSRENFVGKVKDVGKGAKKRLQRGLPQEYLYVFKYACRLIVRKPDNGCEYEDVLIYIKINSRKVPYQKVFIVSFHKNRPTIK